MKIYSAEIKTREKKVPIWPLGDIHLGHEACDLRKLKKYLRWAERDGAYIFLMGDLMEVALPIHKPERGDTWSSEMMPDEEIREITEMLKPFKGKIICGLDGTHEMRIFNLTHLSPTEEICGTLEAQYISSWPAYFQLTVGKQKYNIVLAHGSGYSIRADYQIRKAVAIYRDAEVILIGHNHRIYSEPYTFLGVGEDGEEVEREVFGVRTGAFLSYPNYAREHLYPPSKTGSPIVYLYSNRHIISVNTSGFPEYE